MHLTTESIVKNYKNEIRSTKQRRQTGHNLILHIFRVSLPLLCFTEISCY